MAAAESGCEAIPSSQSGKSLNQRQERVLQESAYAWQFDFSGTHPCGVPPWMCEAPFDPESNELLVWGDRKASGAPGLAIEVIFFPSPCFKLPVRGENTGCVSVPSGAKELELEVDADEEPTAAKEQRLIHLPVEGSHV